MPRSSTPARVLGEVVLDQRELVTDRDRPDDHPSPGQQAESGSRESPRGPKGRAEPSRPRSSEKGKNPPVESPTSRFGIDSINVCRVIPNEITITPRGPDWDGDSRRNPITNEQEDWVYYRSSAGWTVWWHEETRALEIRLSLPRLLNRSHVNYPLHSSVPLARLTPALREIASVLSLRRRLAEEVLDLSFFGVRLVACTADVVVPDPSATIKLLATLPRAGDLSFHKGTSRWKSGTKTFQVYGKKAELTRRIRRSGVAGVEHHHGSLDHIMRVESTITASTLRRIFGLPGGRLPLFRLVLDPAFAVHVLHHEAIEGFKLEDVSSRRPSREDLALGLAMDLQDAATQAGDPLSAERLARLVGYHILFAASGGHIPFRDRFGAARSTITRVARELRDLGFPPGGPVSPYSHRLLVAFRDALFDAFAGIEPDPPSKVDPKDVETHTVVAPWATDEAPSGESESALEDFGPGFEVHDHDGDDLQDAWLL